MEPRQPTPQTAAGEVGCFHSRALGGPAVWAPAADVGHRNVPERKMCLHPKWLPQLKLNSSQAFPQEPGLLCSPPSQQRYLGIEYKGGSRMAPYVPAKFSEVRHNSVRDIKWQSRMAEEGYTGSPHGDTLFAHCWMEKPECF